MTTIALLKSRGKSAGGLEKYTKRIKDALIQEKFQVTLLTTGMDNTPDTVAFPIHTPFSFRKLELFDQAVQKWIASHPSDLIFGMDRNRIQTHLRAGNGVHAAYLQSRLFSEGKLKYWISKYNPLHRKILEIEKEGFEHPRLQKIFTNSNMVRNEILSHYRVDPAKIEVIHNGVEWNEMEPSFLNWFDAKTAFCKKEDLDPQAFHILFVGHGYLRKGLDPLLNALALLSNREVHLSIVGKEKRIDGYQKKVEELGLKKQVRFWGPVSNVTPFYQLADVLAIPSFYDPFANVTVEGVAMGLFVLSSKHNGGSEILNENNGLVIEDLKDQEAVLFALKRALEHRKTIASSLSRRQSVESLNFTKQLKRIVNACR